ncbi:MAG: ester cyclase [Caldilineaceae bacterium]
MQVSEEVVRQWIEQVWNAGNLQQIDHFHPPTFQNEGALATRAAVRAWHEQMRTTFPGLHYAIEEIVVAGDRVVVRWLARATHQGTLWGMIPPTGKSVTWPGIHIVRVEAGQIVKIWAVANQASILQQLGVRLVPPPSDANELQNESNQQ